MQHYFYCPCGQPAVGRFTGTPACADCIKLEKEFLRYELGFYDRIKAESKPIPEPPMLRDTYKIKMGDSLIALEAKLKQIEEDCKREHGVVNWETQMEMA